MKAKESREFRDRVPEVWIKVARGGSSGGSVWVMWQRQGASLSTGLQIQGDVRSDCAYYLD